MNLIFIAPPAAGKGTLSAMLKEKYGFNHISAGDVLREEVKSGSDLGNELKSIMDQGLLIDNSMMKKLMLKKLESLDKSKGFIFDGYPRTMDQIGDYKDICNTLGIDTGYGIYLYIDKEVALKRALGRVSCPKCGKGYNIYFEGFKPQTEGICDKCGETLASRGDDNEEAFGRRYDTYLNETEAVIKVLDVEGRLIEYDGSRNANEIFKEIENFLESHK